MREFKQPRLEKFNRIKYFLQERDIHLDQSELEELCAEAVRQDEWEANVGYRSQRIEDNPFERAFHDQWIIENEPYNDILQMLFMEQKEPLGAKKYVEIINKRDRYIVATIIQWLGTNVGRGFLHAALERVNAKIVFGKLPETGPYKEVNLFDKRKS